MERYQEAFTGLRSSGWADEQTLDMVQTYLLDGDESLIPQINTDDNAGMVWTRLGNKLPAYTAMTDTDIRVLRGVVSVGGWEQIGGWLNRAIIKEKPDEDIFGSFARQIEVFGAGFNDIAGLFTWNSDIDQFSKDGQPNSVGRYLLSLSDQQMRFLLDQAGDGETLRKLLLFLMEYAPDRASRLIEEVIDARGKEISGLVYCELLQRDKATYAPKVLKVFRSLKSDCSKTGDNEHAYNFDTIGKALADCDLEAYGDEVLEAVRASFETCSYTISPYGVEPWMIDTFGSKVVPDLVNDINRRRCIYEHSRIVSYAVKALGKDALPVVVAGVKIGDFASRFSAFQHLIGLDDGSNRELILERLNKGLEQKSPAVLSRFVDLTARWEVKTFETKMRELLGHESKLVRESAARALGKLGDEMLPEAEKMLSDKKAENRQLACVMLSAIKTPAAKALLEREEAAREQEIIAQAMRVVFGESKWKWPPAAWMAHIAVPALRRKDGSELPEGALRNLISLQARHGEIRLAPGLGPLFDSIDRSSSRDFAIEVLYGFISTGANAKDKWALAVAALLGDDRVVSVIESQVKEWADGSRVKLAVYGVQALALLATDRALLAIDSLAKRYRTRVKNVGNAAVEAFAYAAESLGVTPDELADKVIPWMGFEPGKPRLVACGNKGIEVRVGLDHKLRYYGAGSGKKVSSLPSTAPDEVRKEFKDLSALLRDIAKVQALRLENLMVRQYRWPVAVWRELFMGHPIMMPYGIRLVWGAYDGEGRLALTFRVLEDGSLTNHSDESVELGDAAFTGIVHPLELSPEQRQQWLSHLADYEITPPFPQLARPVVICEPDQADLMFYKDLKDVRLNGMTFKGRAERLGWMRGSVCDGGAVTTYWKSFPSAGVDAFIGLIYMYADMDTYTDISLEEAYFVKTGSVSIGSYEYDEPGDEKDPRLVPFGQVPGIVFSEVMGDLGIISGDRGGEN